MLDTNALLVPEVKSFCRLYLEILRLAPDIARKAALSGSGRMVPNSKSAFHIVTSGGSGTGWAGVDAVGTRRTAWSGFAGTPQPPQLSPPVRVWFLTLRPGAVPGPVAGYLPKAGYDCREVRIGKAFEKLGPNVAEVKADNLAAAAARWLGLSPQQRANAGLMAPSHALRKDINAIVRERLVRDGAISGPAMNTERLVSKGYTNAEKSLAANYAPGDVVAFHRNYKRLGVEKGDELPVAGADHENRTVMLEGKDGEPVAWEPERLAARSGGVEVYHMESMELRRGDRIRWTRNDAGLGLVNSQTAEVAGVRDGKVTFRLEDGRTLNLHAGNPQLAPYRPRLGLDRACVSGAHRRYCDRGDGGEPIRISRLRRRSMSKSAARGTGLN